MNYPTDAQVDWNGKAVGPNHSFNKSEVSVFVSDCVGIGIKKGTAWVLWYHKQDGPRQAVVSAGTTLLSSIFEDAESGSLLKEFHEFVGHVRSYLCGACVGMYLPGNRASSSQLGELLQSMFSGSLVFGLHETSLSFWRAPLRDVLSFKILSGDIPPEVVRNVRFSNQVLLVQPFSLKEGKSYIWQAEIGEVGSAQVYTGRFNVADETVQERTLSRLGKVRGASQSQISLRQKAASYFEQGLLGNATMTLIQELDEIAQEN